MVNESFFNLELSKKQRRSSHRDCIQEDIFSIHENIDRNTEEPIFSFLMYSSF